MPMTIAVLPILVIGVLAGSVLSAVGAYKKEKQLLGCGEVILGLSVFAIPMTYFLYKASDEWEAFVPSMGDLALFGLLSFAGGICVAVGFSSFSRNVGK